MMMKIVSVIDVYENCLKHVENDFLTPLTPTMKNFLQKRILRKCLLIFAS